MKINRIMFSVLVALLLVFSCVGTAFADVPLPPGAVKGLPERLAALDDEGNAVNSATGEYFFHVEDMVLGETYTKDIQLMNLRDDYVYHIYFRVEPLFKDGIIDLERGCTCRFFLDGEGFYVGDVNGVGTIDLTQYFDTGRYRPGDSHILRCEITFDSYGVDVHTDNGWRMVDVDGEHVLRGPDESGYAYGEIEFKWIFCAAVDPRDTDLDNNKDTEETGPGGGDGGDNENGGGTPNTGILLRDGMIWLIGIAAVAVAILAVLILLKKSGKTPAKHRKPPATGEKGPTL